MQQYDLKALSREWFEQVWNKHNESAIARLAAPDVVVQGLTEDGQPSRGVGDFTLFWRNFLSAFPDLRVAVEDVIQEGDKTAIRLSFGGSHTGGGIGIEPTNQSFRCTAIVMLHWRDGKIAEGWNEFDAAGMMRQLRTSAAQLRT